MEKNSSGTELRPRVGVGVLILNAEKRVLLGLRVSSHGAGEWAFPGGHIEFGDTIFEAAQREVLEETGLTISNFELISVCDELRYVHSDNKHYINIGVLGAYEGGEPQIVEPDKCLAWQWFALDALPEHLFESTQKTLENYTKNRIYFPATKSQQ